MNQNFLIRYENKEKMTNIGKTTIKILEGRFINKILFFNMQNMKVNISKA